VLPADVAQEALALSSLMASAEVSCKALCDRIDMEQQAPQNLACLSCEIKELKIVLGNLQFLLQDDVTAESVVWASLSDNVANVVKDCAALVADINARVQESSLDLSSDGTGNKNGKEPARDEMSAQEIESFKKHLTTQKITLNMALSMTSLSVEDLSIYGNVLSNTCIGTSRSLPTKCWQNIERD
jgi:hypothetical protein